MISFMSCEIQANPPFPQNTKVDVAFSPDPLRERGFATQLIVQTPAVLSTPPLSRPLRTVLVMALLDTGASRTTICQTIADILQLNPVGSSRISTASGTEDFADYAVDIIFPTSGLRGFDNLQVGSCKLPYDHNLPDALRMAPENFGVLIGRDMMARWNIVWNGRSSSVFVSE